MRKKITGGSFGTEYRPNVEKATTGRLSCSQYEIYDVVGFGCSI